MTRRRLLAVGLAAGVVVLALVLGLVGLRVRDDFDESAGGFAGVSGDLRDALDALAPDELTTIEIANEPGWLHRNDAPESNYQAVWAIPTSPTTPYHAPDNRAVARYLLLDPRTKDSAGNAGHDEWWFVIERYWPSSYPASNHGAFGREVNFHNVAGDAGAQENGNGGVGWDFGSGVSALAPRLAAESADADPLRAVRLRERGGREPCAAHACA